MKMDNTTVGSRYEIHFEELYLIIKDIHNQHYLKISGEIMQLICRKLGSDELEPILEKVFESKRFINEKRIFRSNCVEQKWLKNLIYKIPDVICRLDAIVLIIVTGLIIGGLDTICSVKEECSSEIWIMWIILNIIIHEFGHILFCIRAGRTVSSVGLKLNYGIPMIYVDTSDICMGTLKQKIATSLGGVYGNAWLCIAISIADLFCRELRVVRLSKISFFFILSNLIPFFKLDGYYVLSDWLGEANLNKSSNCAFRNFMMQEGKDKKWNFFCSFFIGKSLFWFAVSCEIIRQIVRVLYSYIDMY